MQSEHDSSYRVLMQLFGYKIGKNVSDLDKERYLQQGFCSRHAFYVRAFRQLFEKTKAGESFYAESEILCPTSAWYVARHMVLHALNNYGGSDDGEIEVTFFAFIYGIF